MPRKYSQDEMNIQALTSEIKKSNELLERHIVDCENIHKDFNDRLKPVEKSYVYFNIYEKLKTVALVGAAGAIGWLVRTVISMPRS